MKTATNLPPMIRNGRAVLAPLSGVTDVAMRRIARRMGAAAVVSEMVACDQFVLRDAETMLRAEGAGITPHIVQLAGRDPAWMAEAARMAEASGADAIDINMGCPAKRVTGGYAGSALMRDPDLASRLIDATVKAVSVPVSVKMRLGWDDASINAPELARRAEQAGAVLVTVHGRTRQQFYKGSARWRDVAAVVAATQLAVIVNGDIASLEDARDALAASGAAAVMVGRAAQGRPWLVGEIAAGLGGRHWTAPSGQERSYAAIEHYETLLALFGREAGLRHARKHVAAYLLEETRSGNAEAARLHALAVRSENPTEVIRILREAFITPDRLLAA